MPAVALRVLACLLALAAAPAHADLYRWIDAETGSVKLANSPPPWYETGSGPAVERIPFSAPAPAGRSAAPGKPAAQAPAAALETRWRNLLEILGSLPRQMDANAMSDTVKQQIQTFQALGAELDRVDPAGRERRAAEQLAVMQKMK
jgi:hypothetical protein